MFDHIFNPMFMLFGAGAILMPILSYVGDMGYSRSFLMRTIISLAKLINFTVILAIPTYFAYAVITGQFYLPYWLINWLNSF